MSSTDYVERLMVLFFLIFCKFLLGDHKFILPKGLQFKLTVLAPSCFFAVNIEQPQAGGFPRLSPNGYFVFRIKYSENKCWAGLSLMNWCHCWRQCIPWIIWGLGFCAERVFCFMFWQLWILESWSPGLSMLNRDEKEFLFSLRTLGKNQNNVVFES